MKVKANIGFGQLLRIVTALPPDQLERLRSEIDRTSVTYKNLQVNRKLPKDLIDSEQKTKRMNNQTTSFK
ncbi:MAG: hypothetical protein WD048_01290 [Chitinophagales bacterium]